MTLPLWEPSFEQIMSANMTRFMRHISKHYGLIFSHYNDFYTWSILNPQTFWNEVWNFCGIIYRKKGDSVINESPFMEKTHFFPDGLLNYAENLLRERDEREACVFWGENKIKRKLSFSALYRRVAQTVEALKTLGVQRGDRVAGVLPNFPETIIAMLATASIGAIWSSCSPDFGTQGILERLNQINPIVLFGVDGYYYHGKAYNCLDKLKEIEEKLPGLRKIIIVPYSEASQDISFIKKSVFYHDLIVPFKGDTIEFEQVPFNYPLFIMFSSGTTGTPKCIVHGHGGTLLEHMKEHQLHCDIKPGDRVFYYTTCGWMMWNWLVSALASKATLILYDGSPFYPDERILFDFAEKERITFLGVSAKYIDTLRKANFSSLKTHTLGGLRMVASTGSPLSPENFDYFYKKISKNACLASISGGTDIIACFALGNPVAPVWKGELQTRSLGLKVEVFNKKGESIQGEKGELVCTAPFPSMPTGFWDDETGEKFHSTYFSEFENVWSHRDYAEITDHQGLIIYGRSDATLKPGGVRIGTAEIYRQLDPFEEILESLAIGQDWQDDIRIILFVKLKDNLTLNAELGQKIKEAIRTGTTSRHVPKKIIQVPDIPKTMNGKIVELAVREIIHKRPVKNKESLINPEALQFFENLQDLQED
jgi:acetoacetyl-CoA synthetase